ncbi:organelle RRM domain-containing protein 6, chloroplastic [Pyrus x bretschneideri]|uniref:organelle RRM domain-containing protein 6, chloroplastic n=1 Tax=Pyrus x bretschneideri TaxID=225117 RepID=UPI00051143BB|nr:organelle RRM domain-containing protein 6, chloroplastic [Pyrus x bretschneideri]
MATTVVILRSPANPWPSSSSNRLKQQKKSSQVVGGCCTITFTSSIACRAWRNKQSLSSSPTHKNRTFSPSASLSPSSSSSSSSTSTKLYVSGLSFRTTEESLRNAFQNFGQLVEVKLVMDRIANRPRGFAFLRYETEEQSQKAIEGMHGKFLDGRVIFVEVAKPRSELRQNPKQNPRRY